MPAGVRTLLKVVALGAAIVVLVKLAGLGVDAPARIPTGRVGLVPWETDGTRHADDFARDIGARAAARLNRLDEVTAVLVATRPPGFGTAAVNRQMRFNYQVGTLLTGRVRATGHRLDIVITMIDTARDQIIWQRALESEETLDAILDRTVEEIASAIVSELQL